MLSFAFNFILGQSNFGKDFGISRNETEKFIRSIFDETKKKKQCFFINHRISQFLFFNTTNSFLLFLILRSANPINRRCKNCTMIQNEHISHTQQRSIEWQIT